MNKKKILIIVISAILAIGLVAGGVFALIHILDKDDDPEYVEKTYTYEEAMEIFDGGDKKEGIAALRTAKGSDAEKKRKELYTSLFGKEFYNTVHNAKVGDVLTFGKFEQDDNYNNGSEPVEWVVLDKKEDGRLLLLTKYAIECVRYHKKAIPITWEECFMRSWLNDGFIKDCFTEEESWIIPTTYVKNDDNPKYGTEGGNDTLDQVFLLSIEEADRYFEDNLARKTSATETAKLHFAYSDPFNNTAWWLRSPSFQPDMAALVADDGDLYDGAFHKVTELYISTRPALWIDLS